MEEQAKDIRTGHALIQSFDSAPNSRQFSVSKISKVSRSPEKTQRPINEFTFNIESLKNTPVLERLKEII